MYGTTGVQAGRERWRPRCDGDGKETGGAAGFRHERPRRHVRCLPAFPCPGPHGYQTYQEGFDNHGPCSVCRPADLKLGLLLLHVLACVMYDQVVFCVPTVLVHPPTHRTEQPWPRGRLRMVLRRAYACHIGAEGLLPSSNMKRWDSPQSRLVQPFAACIAF